MVTYVFIVTPRAGIDKYRVRKKSKRITKFLPKSKLSAGESLNFMYDI